MIFVADATSRLRFIALLSILAPFVLATTDQQSSIKERKFFVSFTSQSCYSR